MMPTGRRPTWHDDFFSRRQALSRWPPPASGRRRRERRRPCGQQCEDHHGALVREGLEGACAVLRRRAHRRGCGSGLGEDGVRCQGWREPERHPERLRPGRPAQRLQAAHRRPAAARRSPSSTPTTTRTPRPTSRPTARSTACRRAPRPTAASRRSTRTAAGRYPRGRTPAGRRRSRSTSTWSRAICPNCQILLVEATSNSIANLGAAVEHGGATRAPPSISQQLRRRRVVERDRYDSRTTTTRASRSR